MTVMGFEKEGKEYEWTEPTPSILVAFAAVVGVTAVIIKKEIKKSEEAEVELISKPLENIPERSMKYPGVPLEIEPIIEERVKLGKIKPSWLTREVGTGTQERLAPHRNMIANTFAKYGVPVELANLVIIETNAKRGLVSRVGARGPWQFMPATGQEYGLSTANDFADFNDWNKSTDAAARYLRKLGDFLHSWDLAVMAYNHGPGNIKKHMTKLGIWGKKSITEEDIWEVWKMVPDETKAYYVAWLSVCGKYQFPEVETSAPEIASLSYINVTSSPHNVKH